MTVDLIADLSAALLRGALLHAPGYAVGPYALDPSEPAGFACVDDQGELCPAFDVHDAPELTALGTVAYEDRCERDWSAFGAARAFVRAVGVSAAHEALTRLAGPVSGVREVPALPRAPRRGKRREARLVPADLFEGGPMRGERQ